MKKSLTALNNRFLHVSIKRDTARNPEKEHDAKTSEKRENGNLKKKSEHCFEKRNEYLPFSRPSIGKKEIEEVVETLRSGWLTMGEKTKRFEEAFRQYVGAKYAISVNSCTMGLFLSLVALGIGDGDEVITTPFTFTSTAHVITHVNARPVFVDIHPETMNIDPRNIEKAITGRTKAIIPVHYGGSPCDMEAINAIARKHGLHVIEDAAHAIGARYRMSCHSHQDEKRPSCSARSNKAGHSEGKRDAGEVCLSQISWSTGPRVGGGDNLTVFSFYANKNITAGEGGMITTPDEALRDKLESLRYCGLNRGAWTRYTQNGNENYEVETNGYKAYMSDLNASIGLAQLARIDEIDSKRAILAGYYSEHLAGIDGIKTIKVLSGAKSSWHLFPVFIDEKKLGISRDRLMSELKKLNIGLAIHFPALHLQKFYREKYGYKAGDFPVAEKAAATEISLPLFPDMTLEDADYVVRAIRYVLAQ